MDPNTLVILLIGGLILLLVSGIPIAFALLIPGLIVLYLMGGSTLWGAVAAIALNLGTSFVFTAVPLFILMAEIFHVSGLSGRLYDTASKWLRNVPGGLAISSIVAAMGFAAICGSSMATAATIGLISTPEMESRNYDSGFAIGVVAAGGTLGILIPPSIPMIIYGEMTDTSVGRLFMAGIIPGIILSGLLMLAVLILVKIRPRLAPTISEVSSWKEKLLSLRSVWGSLVIVVIVMGGIYTGVMTPTEAAAAGAFSALVLMVISQKGFNLSQMGGAAVAAARTTAWILFLITGGMTFGYALTLLKIPAQLTAMVVGLEVNRWVIIIWINLALIVMGCLIDPLTMLLISIPLLVPIIVSLGFDPIWFGVVFVVNMELANITPPVGLNLFVLSGITGRPLGTIILGVIPFIFALCVGLAIVIAFPELSLWLPSTMIG